MARVAAIAILTNVSPEAAEAMEKIPVIGSIARDILPSGPSRTTGNTRRRKVEIPQIGAGNQDRRGQPGDPGVCGQPDRRVRGGPAQGEGNYALDSTYEVVFENEKYVCLRIDTTVSMGSGSSM